MSYDLIDRLNTVREGMESGITDWPIASHIWEYKEAVKLIEQLQAKIAELEKEVESLTSGIMCEDCGDTGWQENAVEGRYVCSCVAETEPYQLLEKEVARLKEEENHALRAQLASAEQRVAEYNELIYAVQTKHPDETRHQTALRYIRNAENRPSNTAANTASS